MDQNSRKYFEQWEPNFRGRAPEYQKGPVDPRPCRDVCCLVIFFVILAAFVGISAYTINQGWGNWKADNYSGDLSDIYQTIQNDMGKFLGTIFGMSVFSLVMSIILLCLIKAYPKCMIYTMIAMMGLIMVGLAVVCFVYGSVAGGVIVLIVLAIYALVFCCCLRQHLDTAVVLARVTGVFLTENPSTFVTSIFVTIIGLGFSLIWIASIAGLISMTNNSTVDPNAVKGLYAAQGILYVFFSFFFYYTMVFLISSSVANWYYQQSDKSMFCTGLRWLCCSHLGSLTFAAVVITIIKIMQAMIKNARRDSNNAFAQICLCLVQCVLNCIDAIVQTLNHYSTICMAFTGQDYIDSAKDAGVIILTNPGLFSTIDMVTGFFFFTILLFSVGLPTLIGVIIAQGYGMSAIAGVVGIVVFIISLLVSLIFVTMFSQSMSAIFVYYCMDKRLREYGVNVANIPREIKEHLDSLFGSSPYNNGNRVEAQTENHLNNHHSPSPYPQPSLAMQQVYPQGAGYAQGGYSYGGQPQGAPVNQYGYPQNINYIQ